MDWCNGTGQQIAQLEWRLDLLNIDLSTSIDCDEMEGIQASIDRLQKELVKLRDEEPRSGGFR